MHIAKNKTNETFFKLTLNVRDILLSLKCQLTAAEWRMWCYLVTLDPFGDSGVKFCPAELMMACGVKRAAYFKAKAKFQKLGLFNFKDGVTKVINLQGKFSQSTNVDSKSTNVDSKSTNVDSKSTNVDSKSTNVDSKSTNVDCVSLKSASEADPSHPQTLQTDQTPQTTPKGVGVENSGSRSDLDLVNKEICASSPRYLQEEKVQEKKLVDKKDPDQDQSSADVVQTTTKRVTKPVMSEQSPVASHQSTVTQCSDIPEDLISKLKDLGISLDAEVKRTIAEHDISQAYGAVRHVENTWETINNPRGVFLHQIPLQRVQKGPPPMPEDFLEWYQWAIADGLVIDFPAKYLTTNYRGEPKVKLTIDPHWAEDWQKVRDNPDDYRQKLDPTVKKQLWAKMRGMFNRPPKAEPETTLNDQLSDPILAEEIYPQIKHTHEVEFTREGQPIMATPIVDIEYDENGVPVDEVKS